MKKYNLRPTVNFEQEADNIYSTLLFHTKDDVIANRIYHAILDAASSLDYFPERNQAFGNNRIQSVGKYSIVYRITGDTVEILRVLPSSSQYIAKLRGNQ